MCSDFSLNSTTVSSEVVASTITAAADINRRSRCVQIFL